MKEVRSLGTIVTVVLVVFVLTSTASAQGNADILDNQWFKVKLSAKGYIIAPPPPDGDGETILGKGSWSSAAGTIYLLMSYDDIEGYIVTTCMRDDRNYDTWHKNTSAPISTGDIYGATYPQVWDAKDNPLVFYDGITVLSIYPIFYTKITPDKANPAVLKSASISNLSCNLSTEEVHFQYGKGSCKLTGTLIPAAQVETIVPARCRQLP